VANLSKIGTVARAAIAAAALHLLGSDQVAAADQPTAPTIKPLERPDRAAVSLPNLEFTPKPADVRAYDSYFYFYKAGVTYDAAFADLDQCRIYAMTTIFGLPGPPKFAPLGANIVAVARPSAPVNLDPTYRYGIGGVIGTAIVYSLIVAPAQREFNVQMNARCMGYRGYTRYGTTRAIWDQINSGSDAEKLGKLALMASGPQPTTGAIAP